MVFLNGPADRGSADGSAILLPAGDDAALDSGFWQLFFHNLVIDACYPAVGFLSHIASANAQGMGDFREDDQVQFCMAFNDSVHVLLEVTGEGGAADNIRAAVMIYDIVQMGGALCYKAPAHLKGCQACVLADHEQVDRVIFR